MTAATTERLLAAIGRLHRGERDEARAEFVALEAGLAADDWFHRCVLAHYLADAQEAPEEALRWDEAALHAAQHATPADFDERFPGMTLASFFPSLHLNLAAGFEQLGRVEEARYCVRPKRTSWLHHVVASRASRPSRASCVLIGIAARRQRRTTIPLSPALSPGGEGVSARGPAPR